jgi:hypothetical protein
MAGIPYTSQSVPISDKAFNGGLNSTAGALKLADNESSDLQNIDFDKFGSILKRNGYATLGSAGTAASDGLHWYEFVSGTTSGRLAITVAGGSIYKMDDLDGVWDIITTAGITISAGSHCDFENFLNKTYVTTGSDSPIVYAAYGSAGAMTVPAGVTKAKFVKLFNNYLFIGNVAMGATDMSTRIYWSNIKDTGTWESDQFIEIAKDDGQPITGLKVLQDRLVVFKTRSIYNVYFTGDADLPFILPGGGKSNSAVGCIAPYSIQEIENGHVFLSHDGLYYYDGANSYKLSYKIQKTLDGLNTARFNQGVSTVYKPKNKYYLALPAESSTTNNRVIIWDYFNNAFSLITGMAPSSMATFYPSGGITETPYFADYNGFTYKMEYGNSDYPLNVATAINAYYYTNWKTYDDLCDQKGIASVYIYHAIAASDLSFSYSYDFDSGDAYTYTFSLATGTFVYGSGSLFGTATFAGAGGRVVRRDLTGRGRVVRFKFANSVAGETFQIDGFGSLTHLETNV